MKSFILLIILAQFTPVVGQSYSALLRNNVSWDVFYYQGSQICGLNSAVRYYIDSDTTINSINYKIIKGHPIVSLLTQPNPFCPPFAVDDNQTFLSNYFMREDTIQQKVYVFDHQNIQEHLLYDFSLSTGDTINSNYPGQGSPFIIDSIGTYLMPDGTSRRIFYGIPSWSTEYYIESVGSSTGLFEPLMWATGGGSRLSCVQENGNYLYSDSIAVFGCLGYVGLEESSNLKQIDISPNPVCGLLNINLFNSEKGIFKLIESAGREVYKIEIYKEKNQIDLTSLKSGMYFYRFESKGQIYSNGKILLQN
jgi:hypothetical protein